MSRSTKREDNLTILDRRAVQTHALRDMLAGGVSFLVCGGPSAKKENLDLLRQRGIWSMSVNNMAGSARTNAFICADPPSKFHHGIWLDPSVMKFVPIPKLRGRRGRLREKVGEEFKDLRRGKQHLGVENMPSVFAFGRRSWMTLDDTFFTDTDAAWGNQEEGVRKTGLERCACTTLLALRVLYYLGARKIYLVGCDFHMDGRVGLVGNYAFDQKRDDAAIESNNRHFRIVNGWLCQMEKKGVFSRAGLSIYNTCERSGLRAFSYVPFEDAVKDALKGFPTGSLDCAGWYEK